MTLVVSWVDEDGSELLGTASTLQDAQQIAEGDDLAQDQLPLRWKRVGSDYMAEHSTTGYGYWLIEQT